VMKLQSELRTADSWNNHQVDKLHASIVAEFLECPDESSQKAAIEFVKYLNFKGLDNENYSYLMEFFLHEKDEVIKAFLGDGKIFSSLKKLLKNDILIGLCFRLLQRLTPGVAFEDTIETIVTILNSNYLDPVAGFEIFPLDVENLNSLARYLDKKKPQSNKINRIILDILADIGELSSRDQDERELFEIGLRANMMRNGYFDNRISMGEVVPGPLLVNNS